MYKFSLFHFQHTLHAEETTSPAPVDAASIKCGFVMERTIVKTMLMKKAVVWIHGNQNISLSLSVSLTHPVNQIYL